MKKTVFYLFFLALVATGCEKAEQQVIISGGLSAHSECKSNSKAVGFSESIPDSLSCVNYQYEPSAKQLSLEHLSAGFNCCPESLYCSVELVNDTILIKEFEQGGFCDCSCLYDLTIGVENLEAGQYVVRLSEPYAHNMESIMFRIDLSKSISGSYCVTRKSYPWGVFNN